MKIEFDRKLIEVPRCIAEVVGDIVFYGTSHDADKKEKLEGKIKSLKKSIFVASHACLLGVVDDASRMTVGLDDVRVFSDHDIEKLMKSYNKFYDIIFVYTELDPIFRLMDIRIRYFLMAIFASDGFSMACMSEHSMAKIYQSVDFLMRSVIENFDGVIQLKWALLDGLISECGEGSDPFVFNSVIMQFSLLV